MSAQYADERADAGTSVNPTAIVPKKRRYVEPVAEIHSARKNEKPRKIIVWTNDLPPVKKDRQSVKKYSQKANPVDESPVEEAHRDVKRQPRKVSTQQSTDEVHSTPLASEKKVESVNVFPVSVLTTKNPVEEVNRKLPIEESRNQPKDAFRKSPETVAWTADAPLVKKGRQYEKKQPTKVSTRRSTNEVHSTPLASEGKVESVNVFPVSDGPPSKKIPTKKETKIKRFWEDTLASDFDSSEYEMLLKKCLFTEDQTDAIKQSFHLLCRKIHIVTTYTDRFMKTHMCIDCQFSISHQCVSVHFSQVQSNGNVVSATSIAPESMNFCICGFGFYHSHGNNSRTKMLDNLRSINIYHLSEHYRFIKLSCPKCHMNIEMKNRNNNVCCDLTTWANLEDVLSNRFYNYLNSRLKSSSMDTPRMQELYSCRRRCCQIFHRCPQNAVPYDNNLTQLSPVTTYTRTLVTRSYD